MTEKIEKKEEAKKKIPPYVPYKTFVNFLDSMKVAVPARVDRGLMRSMSGTLQASLIATLEYLNLIHSGSGIPTDKLAQLVRSEGVERQKHLKDIVTSGYAFIFKDGFDLTRATSHMLKDEFEKEGTSGDTTRKCIAFFMAIAKAAGITLSPYLKKPRGRIPGAAKSKTKTQQTLKQPDITIMGEFQPSTEIPLNHLLLSKFPSFDPSWPDDVKKAWFDAFRELRKDFKKEDTE